MKQKNRVKLDIVPQNSAEPEITEVTVNTKPPKKKWAFPKFSQIFASVGDIGSLALAIIYSTYIILMLVFKIGNEVLNYCILGLTGVYIIMFSIKLFYLNRITTKSKKIGTIAKLIYKYSKYFMKLAAASVVVVSLVNVQVSNQNVLSLIGVIIVLFSFIINLLWDIGQWIIKRKFKELKDDWKNLTPAQKRQRVDGIIKTVVNSLDNVQGIESYLEVATDATKMIGSKVADIQKKGEASKLEARKTEKKSRFSIFNRKKKISSNTKIDA